MGRVLSAVQLKNLEMHKYRAVNKSLMDPLFQKWWCLVVNYVPLWVAPNLLTFGGLLINIFTCLLFFYSTSSAQKEGFSYAAYLCAFGLFFYQTLDAIDGKQARRTNTTSPLGELFDHGCDSLSTIFLSIGVGCCFTLGLEPKFLLYQCIFLSTLFYFAHWETYVTGTMRFGYFDVTEGQVITMALFTATGLMGARTWDNIVFGSLPLKYVIILSGLILGSGSMLQTVYVIFDHIRKSPESKFLDRLRPLVPLVILICCSIASVNLDIFFRQPMEILFGFEFIYSKLTNKLIVSSMTQSVMNVTDVTLTIALLMVILSGIFKFTSWIIGLVFLLFSVGDLMFYNAKVCREICDHMNLSLFTI